MKFLSISGWGIMLSGIVEMFDQRHLERIDETIKDYGGKKEIVDIEALPLSDIFENYETIFPATDNNKFNKNFILLSLREITNMSTKEIRASMKKFKKIYQGLIAPGES